MKKTISLLSILFVSVLWSCSSENSRPQQEIASGEWKLINVQGGIPGSNYNFASGLITWNFDPTNHLVSVVNNNTDPSSIDYFKTGNYIFQTSTEPNVMSCGETITFDDGAGMACIYIENEKLKK